MSGRLTKDSLCEAVHQLVRKDEHFASVFKRYGYPPMWSRKPGFATLLLIILEQQVSLASAKAAYRKLELHLGTVEPSAFLQLSDSRLKTFGFSRQKTTYGRVLARAILDGSLNLKSLSRYPDDEIRNRLMQLKGIGTWSANVYLLMVLKRPDIWPRGDIALATAYKELLGKRERPEQERLEQIATRWAPYRSVAARLLWHFYLSRRADKKN